MGLLQRGECSKCHRTRPHTYGRAVCQECEDSNTGTFSRFSFARVLEFFKRKPPPKVEPPPPLPDPNMFEGSIVLKGRALGNMLAGNDAGVLRTMGMEIADNVPDCAIMTKEGTFEWYKIEFTLKPEERVE